MNIDLRGQASPSTGDPGVPVPAWQLDSQNLRLAKMNPAICNCWRPVSAAEQITRTRAESADSSIERATIVQAFSSNASSIPRNRPTRFSRKTVNCRIRVSSNPAPSGVCGGSTSSMNAQLIATIQGFPLNLAEKVAVKRHTPRDPRCKTSANRRVSSRIPQLSERLPLTLIRRGKAS